MEHEVFVPVPAERLSQALADPARAARAIPGLQQDAGSEPVAGRLRVRAGGHTITYRGTLRIEGRDDGSYAVEGDATEARGTGTAKLSLSLRLTPAEDGTTLTFTGTATADGRIADLPAETVASAATRLLGRFAEKLGEVAEEGPREATEPPTPEPGPDEQPASAGDTEVPASSLEPLAEEVEPGLASDAFDEEAVGALAPDAFDEEPPAEAAHARRTMIGRSAEEVDHAPPRGRYAPVPPPEATAATATLRWAAPAAALLVASAIVAGRLLRRRR
ncbi:SRPBCC family protein [Streptomyces cynarae]|uniref:SRPBCC family protein n=1 Tax=Streptomyces cynarae TaxID=2981134 RepID=UPI00406C94D5